MAVYMYPIGSMYCIFTYNIQLMFMVNVGIYAIPGSHGYMYTYKYIHVYVYWSSFFGSKLPGYLIYRCWFLHVS